MKKSILFTAIVLVGAFQVKAQQDDAAIMVDSLSEVVVTANRINLPFKENQMVAGLNLDAYFAFGRANLLLLTDGIRARGR